MDGEVHDISGSYLTKRILKLNLFQPQADFKILKAEGISIAAFPKRSGHPTRDALLTPE